MTVLAVDDNAENLYLMKMLLGGHGYQVETSHNGIEAMEKLRKDKYELIISDIMMPLMDGFQLCMVCKTDTYLHEIPFIFYTATFVEKKDEDLAYALGADKFIRKPADPDEFMQVVSSIIGNFRSNNLVEGKRVDIEPDTLKYYIQRLSAKLDKKVAQVEKEKREREKVERQLFHSEDKYRKLIENANEGIGVTQDGVFKFVNPRLSELMGYTEEEILSMPFTAFIHPDDCEMIIARDRMRLAGEQFENVYEFRAVNKNKETVWVEISTVLIEWEGRPATLNFFSDVTKRKLSEQKTVDSLSFLNSLIDQSPAPMWISDVEGTLTRINAACCKLLNINEQDVIGKYNVLKDNIVEAQGFMPLVRSVFENGVIARFELKYNMRQLQLINLPESASVILDVTIFPIVNSEDKITNAVIQHIDITEKKKIEENLAYSYAALAKTLDGAINAMAKMVEMKDPYTAGHQMKVAELAAAIARSMSLPEIDIIRIKTTASIHDIGKIYVPSDILSKPGKLTRLEYEIVKTHARGGYEILENIDFDWPIAEIVLQHHERLDGSGYPDALSGDQIRLESRLLAVADVVEAMASHRPYRPALGVEKALEEISKYRGIKYDAEIVDACIKVINENGFQLSV